MSSIFEAYRRPTATETASCGCNSGGGEAIMDADLFADGTSMESVPESAFSRGAPALGEVLGLAPVLARAAPVVARAARVLGPALVAGGGGGGDGGGGVAGLIGTAQSAFDAQRSAFEAGRAGVALARDGMAAVRDGIQTGAQLVNMVRDIRAAYDSLTWEGPNSFQLAANYNPGNLGQQTNVWRFTIACKIRSSDTVPARFPFEVIVTHNCFSIIRARINALSPDIPRTPFSEQQENWLTSGLNTAFNMATAPARAAVNAATRVLGTHRLTIRSSVDRVDTNNFPYRASFILDGVWDPADAGSLRDEFEARITVSSNGSVELSLNSSSRLVSATSLRSHGGPPPGACQVQYGGGTNRPGAAGQTISGGAVPGSGGGSGSGRRWSPSRGSGSRRDSQALLPDPPNGKHIFFANSRSGSTGEIEALLRQWWAALPMHLQNNLQAGQTAIYVDGHADPTGQESRNRELSDQRARSVAGIVRSMLPGAVIVAAGHGSEHARRSGVTGADPSWRRVTVRLDIRQ